MQLCFFRYVLLLFSSQIRSDLLINSWILIVQYNSVYKCWRELIKTATKKNTCLSYFFGGDMKSRLPSVFHGSSFDDASGAGAGTTVHIEVPNVIIELQLRKPAADSERSNSENASESNDNLEASNA